MFWQHCYSLQSQYGAREYVNDGSGLNYALFSMSQH